MEAWVFMPSQQKWRSNSMHSSNLLGLAAYLLMMSGRNVMIPCSIAVAAQK